jgi:hypothetical protein
LPSMSEGVGDFYGESLDHAETILTPC